MCDKDTDRLARDVERLFAANAERDHQLSKLSIAVTKLLEGIEIQQKTIEIHTYRIEKLQTAVKFFAHGEARP